MVDKTGFSPLLNLSEVSTRHVTHAWFVINEAELNKNGNSE